MASADTQTVSSNGFPAAYGYDTQMFRNYVHASAMCWPGFDPASRYSQASLAAAAQTAAVASSAGQSSSASSISDDGSLTQATVSSSVQQQAAAFVGGGGGVGAFGGPFAVHSTTPSTPHKKKAQPVPASLKDGSYWERRRRNNDSARRSREMRRQKEEQIAVRVVYLEQENLQLRTECSMLRAEIEKMRIMIYNHQTNTAGAPQHALKFN